MDEKESRWWLAGTETAGTMLSTAAMISMVEDSEGDIYPKGVKRPGAG